MSAPAAASSAPRLPRRVSAPPRWTTPPNAIARLTAFGVLAEVQQGYAEQVPDLFGELFDTIVASASPTNWASTASIARR